MHRRSRLFAAILAFVVALAAFAASAQTPESTSLTAAASLVGIEAAVVRTWVIDVEFELDVTPEPVPAAVPDVPGASIFQFDSSENAANALVKWIVDEGAAGDDDVIFDTSGASSGGLWGYFPPNDHELLDRLAPVNDETLYPQSSPESEDAVG
ncbi:MAG: hypothetical protein ACR2GI_01790 [Thermomicrobiales bacterium]